MDKALVSDRSKVQALEKKGFLGEFRLHPIPNSFVHSEGGVG